MLRHMHWFPSLEVKSSHDRGARSILFRFEVPGRVADGDHQADGGGQGGELAFEVAAAVTVGPAGIGGDHQPGGVRVAALAMHCLRRAIAASSRTGPDAVRPS